MIKYTVKINIVIQQEKMCINLSNGKNFTRHDEMNVIH